MSVDRRVVLLAAAAMLPFAAWDGAAAQSGGWRRYRNARFGFSIEYPAAFRAGNAPVNGDGRGFSAVDGAEFTVSGSLNLDFDSNKPRSIAQYEAFVRATGTSGGYSDVTYRVVTGDVLILSGKRGDHIFYEKHILAQGGGYINSFVMSYPASSKRIYDPIVARMAGSFHPGRPLGDGG